MFVKEYAADDVIIQQGDDGDNFYIIDKGTVDCFKKDDAAEGAENKLMLTYEQKGAFGELAIMYNAPRAATCIAKTACRLYALERKAFGKPISNLYAIQQKLADMSMKLDSARLLTFACRPFRSRP